jgi:AraC-like DNA-binding protein|nr:AraC family transcriptional regulator [Candidimonas humi]
MNTVELADVGRSQIRGWLHEGVVFETHRGQPHVIPRHAHDAYQVGVTTRDPGEYLCEGKTWLAAPGNIILFHPGQVHSSPKTSVRCRQAISRLLFIDPEKMRRAARMLAEGTDEYPTFDKLVIEDRAFIGSFLQMHASADADNFSLEQESRFISVLGALILRFGSLGRPCENVQCSGARIQAVLDYLEAHYAENISLEDLAGIAEVSPFHLNRVFAHKVGMPPHAFQTQRRIDRAKQLLLGGMSVIDAALETGFFDQSHFTRHFRRIVGVPPRSYVSLLSH